MFFIAGSEDLCPTLVIFGVVPQPAIMTAVAAQMEKARFIDHAMKEVEKHLAMNDVRRK